MIVVGNWWWFDQWRCMPGTIYRILRGSMKMGAGAYLMSAMLNPYILQLLRTFGSMRFRSC